MKTAALTLLFLSVVSIAEAQDLARANTESTKQESTVTAEPTEKESTSEANLFVSEENKVYVKKSEKVYLWISNSEEAGAKKQLLKTHENAMDYFYFDTEGKNTIRSPWAVDPETGEVMSPKHDVVFDVYADGVAPNTQSIFSGAPKYFKDGKVYYGKGLTVNLASRDAVAGVKGTFVSIDSKDFAQFSEAIAIEKENENSISFYSVDNVGNVEDPTTKNFIVDTTSPKTTYEIQGYNDGSIISPKSKIVLASSDNLSQVKNIKYRVGKEGEFTTYVGALYLSDLPEGYFEIDYYATDNVLNQEEVNSTDSKDGVNVNGEVVKAGLFLDKTAPEVNVKVDGDVFEGKYTYVSERTKFELEATDNKAGVKEVMYGVGESASANSYAESFVASAKPGIQYINYTAVDKVENKTANASKAVYLDNKAPKTSITFHGDQVVERDSLFITSDTKIKLTTYENESGVKKVDYAVNGESSLYESMFQLEKEGTHHITYGATDNVNNAEETKKYSVIVDNTPPDIRHTFSFPPLARKPVEGEEHVVLPNYVKIYLAAVDEGTGVKSVTYSINGAPVKSKTTIEYLKKGIYHIDVTSQDILGNESTEVIRVIIE